MSTAIVSSAVSSGRVSFLLHRPRSLDNVGAVARIVKNFGLGRLWLVDPLSHSFDRALKLAVGAEDVVEGLFVERDLETAVESFALVIGTSSRALKGRPSLSPAEVAARVAGSAGKVALVFGEEKRGLSDAELSLCHEVCRIPSDAAQPSLNLAQACAVMGYAVAVGAVPETAATAVTTVADLKTLRAKLSVALDASDFLNPQSPGRILDELLRPLARAQLSPRELDLWGNALRKIVGALERKK